jgi:hypothetical protein
VAYPIDFDVEMALEADERFLPAVMHVDAEIDRPGPHGLSPTVPPWLALQPVIFITLPIGSRARVQPLWNA